jgi:hypothetical protein
MAENVDFAHLLPPTWKKNVQLWLEDDIPSYDIGGFVVGGILFYIYIYDTVMKNLVQKFKLLFVLPCFIRNRRNSFSSR